MTGRELRNARERAGWSQVRLANALGVTQAYLSMMETGKRALARRLLQEATRVLDLPATALPFTASPGDRRPTNERVADDLSRLGYPGLAYRRTGRPTENPAAVLMNALAMDDLDARLAEALPWILLAFEGLNFEMILGIAKARDLQNRLGFAVALAREVAEGHPRYRHRLRELLELERRLENSRLAREDTFGRIERTERMRSWLRDNRSNAAKHWNLLTDLKREHLAYASADSGAVVELPS